MCPISSLMGSVQYEQRLFCDSDYRCDSLLTCARNAAMSVFCVHLSEILFPLDIAVKVQAIQSMRAKKRVHVLAICHR